MYKIYINQAKNKYEYDELIKVFLRAGEYQLYGADDRDENNGLADDNNEDAIQIIVPDDIGSMNVNGNKNDNLNKKKAVKNEIKRYLYNELKKHTGIAPDWGILTGVRPVKLAGDLILSEGSIGQADRILADEYYLMPEKRRLLMEICETQRKILEPAPEAAVGLYIGIPFCPTRCVYCSFPSNQAEEKQIKEYMKSLHYEISFVAENMNRKGWYPETVYIGGGTPTTLSAEQLDELLTHIRQSMSMNQIREFTVEAGRPDTITLEKLKVLKTHHVNRISINPQSMNAKTLKEIGRSHDPDEILEAFRIARIAGIPMINTDIIAGLPGEETEDFEHTLNAVIGLNPENITVHTLAVKRASRLKEIDADFHYKESKRVREMLELSKKRLSEAGYHPYYLYRQKHMTGNFENVGYAKKDTEGIYNIRIMEEAQTIIALGAGGMTKAYYPQENRLERIANVSNFEIYIDRIDEMLQRKADDLFRTGG